MIKILSLWLVPGPLKGYHFHHYFKILLILAWNAESAKNFQVQNFMVYGNMHQSLTRKIGFRVISSFILILFYETDFFLFIMNFQKILKSWNLAYLKVLWAQKQCSKFQNFRLSTKKVIETQKSTQAARPLLFYQLLTDHDNFEVP